MRYLVLGVFSLILLSFSCTKRVEYVQYGEFYFENKTNYLIVLDYPDYQFKIEPGKNFILKQVQDGAKIAKPENYNEKISDKINRKVSEVIVKIGTKCFISTNDSENSIVNINSYVPEKVNDYTYKFTYTFTEADYNRAVNCP